MCCHHKGSRPDSSRPALSKSGPVCPPPVLSCGHLSLCPDLTVEIHKHVTLADQSYQMTDPNISFINPEIVLNIPQQSPVGGGGLNFTQSVPGAVYPDPSTLQLSAPAATQNIKDKSGNSSLHCHHHHPVLPSSISSPILAHCDQSCVPVPAQASTGQ